MCRSRIAVRRSIEDRGVSQFYGSRERHFTPFNFNDDARHHPSPRPLLTFTRAYIQYAWRESNVEAAMSMKQIRNTLISALKEKGCQIQLFLRKECGATLW